MQAVRGGASIAKDQAAARHADPRTTMRSAYDMDDLDDNAVDYVKLSAAPPALGSRTALKYGKPTDADVRRAREESEQSGR